MTNREHLNRYIAIRIWEDWYPGPNDQLKIGPHMLDTRLTLLQAIEEPNFFHRLCEPKQGYQKPPSTRYKLKEKIINFGCELLYLMLRLL